MGYLDFNVHNIGMHTINIITLNLTDDFEIMAPTFRYLSIVENFTYVCVGANVPGTGKLNVFYLAL